MVSLPVFECRICQGSGEVSRSDATGNLANLATGNLANLATTHSPD